jgi:hypothetical protein
MREVYRFDIVLAYVELKRVSVIFLLEFMVYLELISSLLRLKGMDLITMGLSLRVCTSTSYRGIIS